MTRRHDSKSLFLIIRSLFCSTSGSTGVTDIPDILAQTEHGCRVLIDGNALREVLNSIDTYDGKLDLVQDLIRQVGIFSSKIYCLVAICLMKVTTLLEGD
ncbi:unnamed protein product [Brugia timori]|uniref:Uncharacterized protein n=1 Tax=Brugia timori TaxID=42155 RepID=A0A3P7SX87_9BILA|nr:unnamed protein product [Brugia timori]